MHQHKNNFCIFPPGDLDLRIALPVIPDVDHLFSKFTHCMSFHFQVNDGHGTDRGWDLTWSLKGGPQNNEIKHTTSKYTDCSQ